MNRRRYLPPVLVLERRFTVIRTVNGVQRQIEMYGVDAEDAAERVRQFFILETRGRIVPGSKSIEKANHATRDSV